MKKIILAGGSGFLGGALARHFKTLGWEVVVLTRAPKPRTDGAREVTWDARTVGDWARELDGADVVVNLTGKSVDCRYTADNRRLILSSRVDSTRAVGEAIPRCDQPPRCWLNASSAALYLDSVDTPMEEDGAQNAADTDAFSGQVTRAWEQTLNEANTPRTRRVALRTTLVLGHAKNSVFPVIRRLAKFGLGGRMGSGRQYVSWMHEVDFCRAVEWLITHEDITGPVNFAAPNPLPNADMMRAFRDLVGMPIGLPATDWMLEIGAFFLRTETELILKSRRVVPGRLLRSGFQFKFPDFRQAIADLEQNHVIK